MDRALIDLDDWFAPLGLERFTRTGLGRDPFFAAGRPDLAVRLSETLGVASVADLFALREPEVTAWLVGPDGRIAAPPIPAGSARSCHEAGATLQFKTIHEFAAHERRFAEAFQLSPSSAKLQVFANRPGAVTGVHFDPIDVITVQLTGRKTWYVAPNRFAPDPIDGWVPGEPIYSNLRGYAAGPPPAGNPADEIEYVLDPGAVLHVPRGHWHRTFSDRDSVSLHLVLVPPRRMEVLIAALKTELARDRHWRQALYGSQEPDAIHADLRALRAAVERLDPDDLARGSLPEEPLQPHDILVRAGQASLFVDALDERTGRATVTVTAYGFRATQATTIDVDAVILPVCRWLQDLATGDTFDLADILRLAPSLTKTDAQDLLGLLERAHLVRRSGTESRLT